MPTIPQLTATDTVTSSDLVAVWAQNNGDARKAAMSVLLAYLENNISYPSTALTSQYESPSATGFTVTIDAGESTWLQLTPLGGYAAGTIILPNSSVAADKQELLITSSQAVVALTINTNGAIALLGGATSIVAEGSFRLKYDGPTRTWYRIS